MTDPNQPNPNKQPENPSNGVQETLHQAEQTLREAMQSPPYTGSGNISQDDKNVAMLAHVLSAFFGFLPPLVLWLVHKDKERPNQRSVEFSNHRGAGGVCIMRVDDSGDWLFAVWAGVGCQFCAVSCCRAGGQQGHGVPLSVFAALG